MNSNQQLGVMICATLLLLAVLGGIFVLVWHGSVTGEAALAVITTIVGIAGGAFAVHTGVTAGARASNRTTRSGG